LSTDQNTDPAVAGLTSSLASGAEIRNDAAADKASEDGDEQWDEARAASTTTRKGPGVGVTTGGAAQVGEVLNMKPIDTKRTESDNIAEKLRVEETRAQLAAAREGMEREAAKLKEEQEKKEQEKKEKEAAASGRFGAAAASLGSAGAGTGGKWVPRHLRGGGMGAGPGMSRGWGAGMGMGTQKLDVQDEELFPDLAAADKILEQKEKEQQPVFKVPKKTPVGGGASWASKMSPPKKEKTTEKTESAPEPVKEEAPAPAPAAATTTTTTTTTPSPTKIAPKKKKKKDLSTFKPKS